MPCAPTGTLCAHAENPDTRDARLGSERGVYTPGCGLASVTMSWGHDEYLWRVLQGNACTLPEPVGASSTGFLWV